MDGGVGDFSRRVDELEKVLSGICALEWERKRPSFANQGQAMDGISELAEYRARAEKARVVLYKRWL